MTKANTTPAASGKPAGRGDHVYLIDGSGYIFRAYHALPPLTRPSDGLPVGAVLVGRRPTGEICDRACFEADPERDWILTRILWLSGCEPGRNRMGAVDSMRRYIYIHGTPDDVVLGVPGSHGCIRMANADVIDLFDRVAVGTPVLIEA